MEPNSNCSEDQITNSAVDIETTVELITSLQKGEPTAADAVYEAFHNDVYFFILKSVKDPQLASNLTQDTFKEIYENIGSLPVPSAFLPWCRRIAQQRYTAHIKKRRDLLLDDKKTDYALMASYNELDFEFFPDENIDSNDLRQTICDMIDALPEKLRTAIVMRYYDELSIKDIAKIQETSEKAVTNRLTEGRSAIEQSIEAFEKKHNIKFDNTGIIPIILWFFREDRLKNGLSLTEMTPAAKEALANLVKRTSKTLVKKIVIRIVAAVIVTIVPSIFVYFYPKDPTPSLPHTSEITDNQVANGETDTSYGDSDTEFNDSEIDTVDKPSGSPETESTETSSNSADVKEEEDFLNNEIVKGEDDTQTNDSDTENPDINTEDTSEDTTEEPPEKVTSSDGMILYLSDDKTYYTANIAYFTKEKLEIPAEYKGIKITTIEGGIYSDRGASTIFLSNNIASILPNAFAGFSLFADIYYNGTIEQWNSIAKGASWGGNKEHLLHIHCSDGNIERPASEGLTYTLSDDGTYYILSDGTNCAEGNYIIIADEINGVPVTVIGEDAFMLRDDIVNIDLPDKLLTIGKRAFYGCYLKNIDIPDSVTTIEDYAFMHCSLASVCLPENLISIGFGAFAFNPLRTFTIPLNMKNFDPDILIGCDSLISLNVEEGNPVYHSSGNCIIETQSKSLLIGCATSVIPSDGSVTRIEAGAFNGCSFRSPLTVPEGVYYLGEGAFYRSKITSISLPSTLTLIGRRLFNSCSNLTDIYYSGTMEQWENIKKQSDWFPDHGNYTIYCTDGHIITGV